MKISMMDISTAIHGHDDIMDLRVIPVSRQYVTVWDFKKYRLTVKRLKNGWRVLYYHPRKRKV